MMTPQFDKWSLLAGFRFFLALIVAAGHLGSFSAPSALLAIAWLNPFHAILGFLLVSGYSVGSSYLVEKHGFLKRRILRIYPIYLGALVLSLSVWFTIFHGKFPKWETVAANLFFLNQIVTNFSLIGPAWSLSLEFWLYCMLPFLFRKSPSVLRTLCYGSFFLYLVYTLGRSAFHWPYYCNTSYGLNLPILSFVWICGLRLADQRRLAGEVFLDLKIFLDRKSVV
jgi:peptidoglycan/LPS O-acetylase OafA/YrhL